MTVRFYTHSIAKRAKAVALVDSGATKNFLNLQSLKKLSQYFAILERVTWNKSNKLSNIVKIMYVILHHLGIRKYSGSCDVDQK